MAKKKQPKFKPGQQVVFKKPFNLKAEYLEIEHASKHEFHGFIKVWGFTDEIKKDTFFKSINFGGVVYESPKMLKSIKAMEKSIRKQIREEEKNEKV